VTALAEGAATITVTSVDGGYIANCIVNVVEKNVGINQDIMSTGVGRYP